MGDRLRYCSWFYGHTAPVRFESSKRYAKAEWYHHAAIQIEDGKAPEDVGIPGVGTRMDAPTRVIGSQRFTSTPPGHGRLGFDPAGMRVFKLPSESK